MDARTALKKVHLIEINSEIEVVQDAIFGYEKADILVFYIDSFGSSKAINLSSLKNYPLNVEEEIKAMLKMTLATCKSLKSELQ